jgi:hypothetical protein
MIVYVVDAYARTAADFDVWLIDRISQKYTAEIPEFLQAQEQYQREYARVFGI